MVRQPIFRQIPERKIQFNQGGALANMIILLASLKMQSPTGKKPVGLKKRQSQLLPDQNRSANEALHYPKSGETVKKRHC
jgi:hypothetical protein